AAAPPGSAPAPGRLVDPDRRLGPDWRTSGDRAVTVTGDAEGLHVLVADRRQAYRWRTAASLREPGVATDQWVGQACVTGSGRRAAVVYAPRQFTNRAELLERGAFAAVVDLATGAVTKLAHRVSLAYHNPGCGAGEAVALSRLEVGKDSAHTWLATVDAERGGALVSQARTSGQLTSAVPLGDRLVAAKGNAVVEVDRTGATVRRTPTAGTPFRLLADGADGVAFQVARGADADFARYAGQRVTVAGSAPLGTVKLRPGAGGTVYAVGARATKRLPGLRWRAVDALPDSDVSTTGALVVSRASTGREAAGGGGPADGQAGPVDISAKLAGGGEVAFSAQPAGAAGGQRSPALGGSPATQAPGALAADDPATVPWDPDRSCAVPRNDPRIQVYQPTRQQAEWAANLAIRGQLTFSRAANWLNSGMPAFSPQGMFPPKELSGGGHVPAQVLLAILAQESNLWQASWHAVDASAGNPLTSLGFYGLDLMNPDPTKVDWSKTDCGYGVGQVTTGMRAADTDQWINGVQMDYTKQKAVVLDYATNIAAALRILQDKWNTTRNYGLIANNGDPQYIENWWFAVWAYNTGFYERPPTPGVPADYPWGVGWANNPANPNYPADRQMFLTAPLDVPSAGVDDKIAYDNAKHPNHWSYPERVMGFAYTSLRRYNYNSGAYEDTYATAQARHKDIAQAGRYTFCVYAINKCDRNISNQPSEHPDEPAGPCEREDLKCWWHEPATWADCQTACGVEARRYTSVEPRPLGDSIYQPQCTTAGLPSGARIIDDIDSATALGPEGCARSFTPGGSFSLRFDPRTGPQGQTIYPGKVDLHQIGGGFGGHFWFAHSQSSESSPWKATGTWTPGTRLNGWARVMVHLPDHGAHTQQAHYVIRTGTGVRHRYIPTRREANAWVTLGTYQFSNQGAQSVELSNITKDGQGLEDVAWDALAFVPLAAKPQQFVVAMGDSYGSGEGAGNYYYETDNNYGNRGWNACRRSLDSWPRKTRLPGNGNSIGQRVGAHDPALDFQFVACSGAQAAQMSATSAPSYWLYPPSDPGEYGVAAEGQFREVSQVESGVLSGDTTLVLLSAGGNDAGFPDAMSDCAMEDCAGDEAALRSRITAAQVEVRALMNGVRSRAPNATIMLVGYPRLFASYHQESCVFARYSAAEMSMMNRLALFMRDEQARTVAAARAAGMKAQFTDMVEGFLDHGTCRKYDLVHNVLVPDEMHSVVAGPEGEGDFRLIAGDSYATCVGWIQTGVQVCLSRSSFHPKVEGTTTYANAVTTRLAQVGL
ncbi:MAG TPA: SGNH/GDSL hydrolase family protein, partial [Pilimelia sp.]|nr:SGNH/GDSL hydrolase family protein [Pilimelia sp.]